MDIPIAELRAYYDARADKARQREDEAERAVNVAIRNYQRGISNGASIDVLDALRSARTEAELARVHRRNELDRVLDQRSNDTGTSRLILTDPQRETATT